MAYTIAFFGTKPYDESSFNDKNKEFGHKEWMLSASL